jgi:hypothetical protein
MQFFYIAPTLNTIQFALCARFSLCSCFCNLVRSSRPVSLVQPTVETTLVASKVNVQHESAVALSVPLDRNIVTMSTTATASAAMMTTTDSPDNDAEQAQYHSRCSRQKRTSPNSDDCTASIKKPKSSSDV